MTDPSPTEPAPTDKDWQRIAQSLSDWNPMTSSDARGYIMGFARGNDDEPWPLPKLNPRNRDVRATLLTLFSPGANPWDRGRALRRLFEDAISGDAQESHLCEHGNPFGGCLYCLET
jgi:hypothetical protein